MTCEKCGSPNILFRRGEYECMACGHTWSHETAHEAAKASIQELEAKLRPIKRGPSKIGYGNVNVSIPSEIFERMKRYPINWSGVARRCIINFLEVLEKHKEEFTEAYK